MNSSRKSELSVFGQKFSLILASKPKAKTADETSNVILVKKPIHHYFCVDVSGSMSGVLDDLLDEMANKISTMALGSADEQYFTIIYFSGSKSECGILLERYSIKTIEQQATFKKTVASLRTIGLTNFIEPMKLIEQTIKKHEKKDEVSSVWFMSDGGHNTGGSFADVLSAVQSFKAQYNTVVEFGRWADRKALLKMSETMNGRLISSANLQSTSISIEEQIKLQAKSTPMIEVSVSSSYLNSVLVSFSDRYSIHEAKDGKIAVPEDYERMVYLSEQANNVEYSNEIYDKFDDDVMNYAVYLAQKDKKSYSAEVLRSIGNSDWAARFKMAVGKPSIDILLAEINQKKAAGTKYWTSTRNFELKFDDNAYCLLNLLTQASQQDALFFPYREYGFEYENTTRKRVVSQELSAEDSKQISELYAKQGEAKSEEEKRAIRDQIKAIEKKAKRMSETVLYDTSRGISMKDLVWNGSSPNISVRVSFDAKVPLLDIDEAKANGVSDTEIKTKTYRTYTIVKNGTIHTDVLPMKINKTLFSTFRFQELLLEEDASKPYDAEKIYPIQIGKMKYIINELMVSQLTFKKMAESAIISDVFMASKQKVLKYLLESVSKVEGEKTKQGLVDLYGETGGKYLQELGFTTSGNSIAFNPKGTAYASEVSDVIDVLTSEFKISGFSSIPKIEDVQKKAKGGKLTASQEIVRYYLDFYEKEVQNREKAGYSEHLSYFEQELRETVETKRQKDVEFAQDIFVRLIGGADFGDNSNPFDKCEVSVSFDGYNGKYSVEYSEKIKQEKL